MRGLGLKLLQDLRASYWFLPTCLVVAAGILAFVMLRIDRGDPQFLDLLPEALTDTQLDGARAVLSVIATSVIGVTGVMFSVTMVAVSFASGNFGPRLIGNFMRDRGNQWSLAALIATFVYTLFILRSLHGAGAEDAEDFVPQASIIMAMGLTVLCVFVMIYFVHHVPETINVSNIAATLGKRFHAALVDSACDGGEGNGRAIPEGAQVWSVGLEVSGYLQRLEVNELDGYAQENGLRLRVLVDPGDFVFPGLPVLEATAPLDEATADRMRSSFAVGKAKTENQNLLFLAEQQIEMIARAMSPGVNDPYTATNCLNWLAAGLSSGAARGDCFGLQGTERVIMPRLDLSTLLQATFGAAYPYVRGDRIALQHWNNLLDQLETVPCDRLTEAVAAVRRSVSDGATAPGL